MPAVRRAVAFSKNDVRVQFRLAFIKRDIADERHYLDLFVYRNVLIFFFFQIVKGDRDALERAEPRKKAAVDLVLFGKFEQTVNYLITGLENDDESSLIFVL